MHGEGSAQRNEWTAGAVPVVTKASPVVVRPSELELERMPPPPPPARSTTVPLTSFDKRVPPMPATSLLVFDRPIDSPVETIKQALSRALAYYRAMAGRLDGAGGIACTDEGVTFVGAAASCALKDATAMAALQEMDLVLTYPGLLCRDADPLLLVQVTEFACGGFVVAGTSNHVAADGVGMAQFLRAIGELARGISPPSCIPVRSWDEKRPVSSTIPSAKGSTKHGPQHLAPVDIVIPSDLIRRIRGAAGGLGGGGGGGGEKPRCSVLDAVMAVLWRCRTRAIMSPLPGDAEDESPAPLQFVCNMRALAGAPAGYYGNCIRVQVVPATAGVVASSGIGHLVGLIGRAKEKVPDLLSTPAGCGGGGAAGAARQGLALPPPPSLWYETFTVTDWRNLGLDAVDFGGGPPERVLLKESWRAMVPGCVVCPPCTARSHGCDGVVVSSTFVKPEHVDALLAELAAMAASPE